MGRRLGPASFFLAAIAAVFVGYGGVSLGSTLGPGLGIFGPDGDSRTGGGVTTPEEIGAPGTIGNLAVIGQTDSSVTLRWTIVSDGAGGRAYHAIRADTATAGFGWGHAFAGAHEVFDSSGTSVGDTVTHEFVGLAASTYHEFGIKAYRGEPNVDAEYSETSNTPNGTTDASSLPSTPTLTSVNVLDTSNVSLTSSSFGGGGSHDSTEWEICRAGTDCSSPISETTSTTALTSITITDNTNFKADTAYVGRVRHYDNPAGWSSFSDTVGYTNTQPPSGGDHPNEPSGMTTISDNPFDVAEPSGWSLTNHYGTLEIVGTSDCGTAPISPSNLGRFQYTIGEDDGAPAQLGRSGFGYRTFYWDAAFCIDDDWQGHQSDVNKLAYTVDTSSGLGGPPFYTDFRCTNLNTCNIRITRQAAAEGGALDFECDLGSNVLGDTCGSEAEVARGEWVRLEVLIVLATPGNSDGTLDVWINEAHALDFNNVSSTKSTWDGQIKNFQLNPIWGGTGDLIEETMYMWWDNLYLSGKN